jgi:hypothetical protein
MSRKILATLLLFVLLLGGCGGGSNSGGSSASNTGTPTSTPGQAQGVYDGSASTGTNFESIVLPNDQLYAIYGSVSGNVFLVCGLITGQGASASGTYTANVTDFDDCTGSLVAITGSVTASYMAGSSLNGSLTENGNTITFTGTAPAGSLFNYNGAASISDITGSWTGAVLGGESVTVTIGSDGSVSGSGSSGCSFSGTVTPDSSGKNFFDVSITYGGAPCTFPNQSGSGIAVDYLLSDGVTRQLIAAATLGSSTGTVFFAQR